MPTEIVAETCPAPECNLTPRDVKRFLKELRAYQARFKPAFRRPEQFERSAVYLNGLLGDTPRKTIEPIALALGENVRNLRHFIGQSQWTTKLAVQIHQGLIAETLGEEDGVACSTQVWRRRRAVVLPPWSGRGPHPTRLRLRTPSHRVQSLRSASAAGILPAKWSVFWLWAFSCSQTESTPAQPPLP